MIKDFVFGPSDSIEVIRGFGARGVVALLLSIGAYFGLNVAIDSSIAFLLSGHIFVLGARVKVSTLFAISSFGLAVLLLIAVLEIFGPDTSGISEVVAALVLLLMILSASRLLLGVAIESFNNTRYTDRFSGFVSGNNTTKIQDLEGAADDTGETRTPDIYKKSPNAPAVKPIPARPQQPLGPAVAIAKKATVRPAPKPMPKKKVRVEHISPHLTDLTKVRPQNDIRRKPKKPTRLIQG